MDSDWGWKWLTVYEYFGHSPFAPPEDLFVEGWYSPHPEYNVGDVVEVAYDDPICKIIGKSSKLFKTAITNVSDNLVPKDESDEDCAYMLGTIVCKRIVTEDDIDAFVKRQRFSEQGLEALGPTIERVKWMCREHYLGKMAYCVHLTDCNDYGSTVMFNLPWMCDTHRDNYICHHHASQDIRDPEGVEARIKVMKSIHYTCIMVAV